VTIRFLQNDEIEASQITARIQAQFGEPVYKLPTVIFWIAEGQFDRQDLHDEIRTGRPPLHDLDAKNLAILDKSTFESAFAIAERLRIDCVTVLEHFPVSIGFKSFHLRWMLYLLTGDLRQKRKEHASAMFPFLYAAQRDGWHHLVIGDESWFFFNASLCRMCTLSRDDMATKSRLGSQSRSIIFIVIWNSSGVCIVDRLPNDTKNEQRLLCDKYTCSIRTSDLSSGKSAASNTTYDLSRQLLSSHRSGFKRLARKT
jgi:hypothetical protein